MKITTSAAEEAERSPLVATALAAMNARDRGLDAQLPDRGVAADAAGRRVLAAESDGAVRALGRSLVERLEETEPGAIWGALRRASLELRWDGEPAAVEALLARWIDETRPALAGDGPAIGTDDWETSLQVTVPSRDSGLVLPLLAQGFAPIDIEGIRLGRRGAESAEEARAGALRRLETAGARLRPANPGDAALLAEMDTELLAHEVQHGGVTRRPGDTAMLGADIEQRLLDDPGWTWVVEQGGGSIGYLSIELDKDRYLARVAPGAGPLAFLQAMYLRPAARGGGLGEAVVDFGHAELAVTGCERILLNYSALNPRSGPFWCRMGYRPLWTTWQRRPAR